MQSNIDEILILIDDVSRHKKNATGLPFSVLDSSEWPTSWSSETEFKGLVTFIYKRWREAWERDIEFISSRCRNREPIKSFRATINHLRTANEHIDNAVSIQWAADWRKAVCGHQPVLPSEWSDCGDRLLLDLSIGLRAVRSGAREIAGNVNLRSHWTSIFGVSAEVVLATVVADLGLSFSDEGFKFHVRHIQKDLDYFIRRNPLASNVEAENVGEIHLVSNLQRLPVHYREVLDALNLIGQPTASSCLRVAHAIAEVTSLQGDEFIGMCVRLWTVLRDL